MAQLVAKVAAKRLLGKEMEKYKSKKVTGDTDPFYALIEDPRRPGKMKKVKRQVPDYIPEHDALILANMRKRAYRLDCSLFSFCGVRFGWSSVIGLIPAAGDAIDAALATLLFMQCTKVECGLGSSTTMMMIINIFIDFLVGLIPFIGDIADAGFKANSKNVRLLEQRLDEAYKPDSVKKAEKAAKRKSQPATVYEDFESDSDRLPMHRQDVSPARPAPARVPTETRGGEKVSRKGTLKKSDSRRDRKR